MKFQPLSDQILVRVADAATQSPGGILIPETAQDKPQEGEVLAVGRGSISFTGIIPPEVGVGDKIMFSRGAGFPIKVNGEDLVIMAERNVMGIVR